MGEVSAGSASGGELGAAVSAENCGSASSRAENTFALS